MRIAGANEFFSRFFTWPNQNAANNAVSPFLPGKRADIIDISEIGKRLSFRSDNVSLLDRNRAAGASDPMIQLMDRSITNVETILNQMKDLALAASKASITDRLQMQIEMEDLRYELSKALNSMSKDLAKTAGHVVPEISNGSLWISLDDGYGNTENAVLKRALARALNGEAWDVGETHEVSKAARTIFVGGDMVNVGKWGDCGSEWFEFELPPGMDPSQVTVLAEVVGYRVVPTDDKNAPTVSQILERSGTIVLLDDKSAAEGVERIEKELEALREMRKALVAFSKQNSSTNSRSNRNTNEADGIHTELGVMEGVNGKGLRLTKPTNPKGMMFAQIERLFDKISNNLMPTDYWASNPTPEEQPARKIVWTNWNPPRTMEKAG